MKKRFFVLPERRLLEYDTSTFDICRACSALLTRLKPAALAGFRVCVRQADERKRMTHMWRVAHTRSVSPHWA